MAGLKYLLLACLVLSTASAAGATPLFEDDSTLEMELTGPLWTLIENKEDKIESPFVLRADGVEHEIKVRARGNSRMRACDFPMLRFNFNNRDTSQTVFAGQNKLKLVTHCRKGDRSEMNVLLEYAAYQIFNVLSEVSYRVRLVNLTYTDTDDHLKQKERHRYGFLIEPREQLAARVGGSISELPGVALRWLNPEQAALVYVFQYLISNTDWSLITADGDESCCHNGSLLKIDSKQYLVPYDFDLAGLVNASYAYPDPSLKIKKVRQRLYRGFCTDHAVLQGAIDSITSMEDEIQAIIAELPVLSDKDKAKQRKYLDKFFKKATDKNKLTASFEKSCHP